MCKKVLIFIMLVFLFTGCSVKNMPIQNKISDKKDLNLGYIEDNYVLVEKRCSNTKQRWYYTYIPVSGFIVFEDDYVIDEMLNKCDGDIATNVELHDTTFIALLINYYSRTAIADVWRKK